MKLVGKRAQPALIDMCRWKDPGHSFQACLVLGRLEGLPDITSPGDKAEVLLKVGAGSPASN
jgi:hypothetical protein